MSECGIFQNSLICVKIIINIRFLLISHLKHIMAENYFLKRHSFESSGDENVGGLSPRGIEAAKNVGRSQELVEFINSLPKNSLVFIGGATEAERTVTSGRLYEDGLKEFFKNDAVVIGYKTIKEIAKQAGSFTKIIEAITGLLDKNEGKKVVIDFPVFIKELSFGKRWGFWSEKGPEYFDYLMNKYNNDEDKAYKEWIETKGKGDDGIEGPIPDDVADEYMRGLMRLKEFCQKYAPGRPITIGAITHRWDIDAFVLKMAKEKVDEESFREVAGDKLSDENEGTYIRIEGNDLDITYRGKKYARKIEKQKLSSMDR